MNRRLRRLLHRYGVAVYPFAITAEARRATLLQAHGIDVFFDLGANVGNYAYWLRDAGYAGRIVSIEPIASLFAQLADAARDDRAWEAVQVAVASEPGSAEINVSERSTFSSLLPVRDEYVAIDPEAATRRTEMVSVTTLDSLVEDHARPHETVGIKMDVQGGEWAVLDGGEDAIERAVVLELEVALVPSYEHEHSARELLDRVFDYGFRLAIVENVMYVPDGSATAINAVFMRPRSP